MCLVYGGFDWGVFGSRFRRIVWGLVFVGLVGFVGGFVRVFSFVFLCFGFFFVWGNFFSVGV